jgi:7-cyano-7-deazaguanine synthase
VRNLILFSGGMDSALLAKRHPAARLLFVRYGQPHEAHELCAARAIAGNRLEVVKMPLRGGFDPAGSPVMPGRNAALLSLAVNLLGDGAVLIGCCAADAALFPDCRPDWIAAFNEQLRLSDVPVRVRAPLLFTSKREIRAELGDWLGDTWSCYYPNGAQPCGKCGACKARGE